MVQYLHDVSQLWAISSTDRVTLSEGVDRGSIPRWLTNEKPLKFQHFQGFLLVVFCKYIHFLGRKRCYLVVLGVTLGVTLFAARIVSDPKIRLEFLNFF